MKETIKNITLEKVLTESEKMEMGEHLVKLVQDLEKEQDAKAREMRIFNKQIKFLQEGITKTARELNLGIKEITISARCETDSITGDKYYYDLITGELLKTEFNDELNPDQMTIGDVLLKTELNDELNPDQMTIGDILQDQEKLDEYSMSQSDYILLLREKYSIPTDITFETDNNTYSVGVFDIDLIGTPNQIDEWLSDRDFTEEVPQRLNLIDGNCIQKILSLTITDYDVQNFIELRTKVDNIVTNIFENNDEEKELEENEAPY